MTRTELIRSLDALCWDARGRYGHEDYGLDSGVDINGEYVDEAEDSYHREAVALADRLIKINVVVIDA
jgi:hypothetical protein